MKTRLFDGFFVYRHLGLVECNIGLMKRLWRILPLGFVLLGQSNNFFRIPVIDLNHRRDIQVIVDKESGVYLGHPTTVLLEDGKTILAVYPKGHGAG